MWKKQYGGQKSIKLPNRKSLVENRFVSYTRYMTCFRCLTDATTNSKIQWISVCWNTIVNASPNSCLRFLPFYFLYPTSLLILA